VKLLPSSRSLLLALGLLAPAAQAMEPAPATAPAQSELLALHPCAIEGEKNKALVQGYQAACAAEFSSEDVRRVPDEQVLAFLNQRPGKSCAPTPQSKSRPVDVAMCLGRLAAATQASRAVLISVSPGQLTRVSGLVVNAQGEVVDQKSIQMRSHGQPPEELLHTALASLRKQLKFAPPAPASPPVVEPQPSPPVTEAPPPTPQPSEPAQAEAPPPMQALPEPIAVQSSSTPRAWRRPAAYASAGVGVVALGLAGFFALSSNGDVAKSNEFYKDNAYPAFNQLDEIVRLRDSASTKRTLAGVSAGVGAALIGAGAYLWLQDRPAAHAPGVAALSVGPNGVSVLGFLP
jgi:hypothetical protein